MSTNPFEHPLAEDITNEKQDTPPQTKASIARYPPINPTSIDATMSDSATIDIPLTSPPIKPIEQQRIQFSWKRICWIDNVAADITSVVNRNIAKMTRKLWIATFAVFAFHIFAVAFLSRVKNHTEYAKTQTELMASLYILAIPWLSFYFWFRPGYVALSRSSGVLHLLSAIALASHAILLFTCGFGFHVPSISGFTLSHELWAQNFRMVGFMFAISGFIFLCVAWISTILSYHQFKLAREFTRTNTLRSDLATLGGFNGLLRIVFLGENPNEHGAYKASAGDNFV